MNFLNFFSQGRSRFGNRDRMGGRGGGMRGGFRDQRDSRKPFQSGPPSRSFGSGSEKLGSDSHRSNNAPYSQFHSSANSHSFSRSGGQDNDRGRGPSGGSRFGDSRTDEYKRSNSNSGGRGGSSDRRGGSSGGRGRWETRSGGGANGSDHYSSQPQPLMHGFQSNNW